MTFRQEPGERPQRLPAPREAGWLILAALPALALYSLTFCRTAYGEFDSAELATIVPTGGVPHAPGYPLYVIVARALAACFPGEPAAGVNFASALLGAAGVALAFALVRRLTGNRLAALVAAWSLAASFTYWYMSCIAEVYVAQAAMELATALALVAKRPRAFALCMGLCFALHPASVLVAGPFGLGLFLDRRMRRVAAARWRAMGALFCAPVVLYLYFPIACHVSSHPGFWVKELGIDLARPADLLEYMTLRHYPKELYRFEPAFMVSEIGYLGQCLVQDFTAPGAILATAGLLLLLKRRRAAAVAIGLGAVAQMSFYLAFTAVDKFTMFCPAMALFAVGIGVAAAETSRAWRRAGWVLLALPVVLVITHYERVDKSGYEASNLYARDVLSRLEPGAVVIAGWQAATMLDYATAMRGMRPDVDVRHDGLALLAACWRIGVELGDPRGRFALEGELLAVLRNGLPLYATFVGPELTSSFEREAVGPAFRLRRRRTPGIFETLPADWPRGPQASFPGAELRSLQMRPARVRAGEIAKLVYRWRLLDPSALDTLIRLVVTREGSAEPIPLGTTRFRWQLHALGMLRAKAARVAPGVFLEETFDFTLPPIGSDTALAPGRYTLGVRFGREPARAAGGFEVLAPSAADGR